MSDPSDQLPAPRRPLNAADADGEGDGAVSSPRTACRSEAESCCDLGDAALAPAHTGVFAGDQSLVLLSQ